MKKAIENNSEHDLVYVKKSAIHGRGLFAKTDIKEGAVLGEVEAVPAKSDGPYVLWINDAKDGFEVKCLFKYINHNKRANACYCDDFTVIALKDIKAGEEITHDYGDDWLD
ncbi:MAG: SET domain-containing protein-lysine N-methyltransferase [Gammaproteobacteria bacterium]|nr:SET domain-containing protein-lysine N-methyltransferase [Gammaproteobacteria bacterium]MDH5802288.1 SET domain-containing protein-lysine N-methyltransferase [Gammaproteobacteria bacterium]